MDSLYYNDRFVKQPFSSELDRVKWDVVFREARLCKGLRVIDIGSGSGYFGKVASRLGCKVVCLDIDYKAVDCSIENGVAAFLCDCQKSIPDSIVKKIECELGGKADLIVSSEVIEHVFDTQMFFLNCERLLCNGGRLVLTTPNLARLRNRLLLLFGELPAGLDVHAGLDTSGHIRGFTVKELCKLGVSSGFVVSNVGGCWFFPPVLGRFGLRTNVGVDVWPSLLAETLVVCFSKP